MSYLYKLFFVAVIGFSVNATSYANDGEFSRPINSAEWTLNSLLTLDVFASEDERFGPLQDFIIGYPNRDKKFDHFYANFFSRELLLAWHQAEQEQVALECGGKYINGELCGLSVNPLTCAHDFPSNGYVYNTLFENEFQTTVLVAWNGHEESTIGLYRLVKENKHWVLDSVSCTDGAHFN